MNPLALNLNEQLNETNPNVLDMLSDLGKSMYYPKGILTQSAEPTRQAEISYAVFCLKKKIQSIPQPR